MEIPANYTESDVVMIIAAKDERAMMDIIVPGRQANSLSNDEIEQAVKLLTMVLCSSVDDELKKNKVAKTLPLLNLCAYAAYNYPEVVIDDSLYKMRRAIIRTVDILKEHPSAVITKDAFMEIIMEESEKTYQFQIVAVCSEEDKIDFNKIKIYDNEEGF